MNKPSYDNNSFVGREDLIQEVNNWLASTAPKPLKSIVGSPGIGKSWLLGKLDENLKHEHIIFWPTQKNWGDSQFWQTWIEEQIDMVRAAPLCHGKIRDNYPLGAFSARFSALVEDLCNLCNPLKPPILFFDGFDEIGKNGRAWVEEHLLKPFLSRKCCRVILARRGNIQLEEAFLRWRQEILTVSTFNQGDQEAYINSNKKTVPKFEKTQEELAYYKWNHPWLNHQLLDSLTKVEKLTEDIVKQAIKNLIAPEEISEDGFELLVLLSTMIEEWTERDVRAWIKDKPKLSGVLPELHKFGVVQETSGPFRKVNDGIRELALAYDQLR